MKETEIQLMLNLNWGQLFILENLLDRNETKSDINPNETLKLFLKSRYKHDILKSKAHFLFWTSKWIIKWHSSSAISVSPKPFT